VSAVPETWRSDLGLGAGRADGFFASKADLDSVDGVIPHAHVIRRAFDLLDLNGVLCDQAAPLVYFKVVDRIRDAKALELHRRFWNHGGAPILALIAPSEVHIYSALARPSDRSDAEGRSAGLVTTIDRASVALREFLPAVESGEFFRKHAKSFKPAERVDQALLANLQATREKLSDIAARKGAADVLDAFLCRLVFTCYLFDRKVIGSSYLEDLKLPHADHLRDVLGIRPRLTAKTALYRLFSQLAKDFNGDLFSDDLDAEAMLVSAAHIEEVDAFFRGTDVLGGQQAFWPYDFAAIPIETISAIYERFLKSADKKAGAFYTPRFLAELVLDVALSDRRSLCELRYLDPACGSGIFLVGLFNRMAEEWKRAHPQARNDRRARELMELLRSRLYGIDLNPTACRITAFSLYLAYLDQLAPRDIQELQAKGRALPNLIRQLGPSSGDSAEGGIWCGDFFNDEAAYPSAVDMVVGNPPWGSSAGEGTEAARWLEANDREVPDGQIAAAFMWKAATHAAPGGRICFLVPHGILYNHSRSALDFQRGFLKAYAVDRVLNLTDYQFFLFSKARHPALVVSYRNAEPIKDHKVRHWAPKTDWKVLRAEVITVSEQDQSVLALSSILRDLDGDDAPQVWKRASTATARDRRLLDRLSDLPRLRDCVRQTKEKGSQKRWLIAEGYQPVGPSDDRSRAAMLDLPSNLFVDASSPHLQLFLIEEDCARLPSKRVEVRARSNKVTEVFGAPHVLVAQGFGSIAFADFSVSFRHALRGITGPSEDRALLMFLAAYLRSPVAKYFQFHTSSNWGVSRQKVHVEELLRLPFPPPDVTHDSARTKKIIRETVAIMHAAIREARETLVNRVILVAKCQAKIDALVYEYFDVTSTERILIEETVSLTFESFRPSAQAFSVPAIEPSTVEDRERYTRRLCQTLNSWAEGAGAQVSGGARVSRETGMGLVVLETSNHTTIRPEAKANGDLFAALDKLRDVALLKSNTFELARGIKVFDGSRLYMVKPLSLRYWSETAALNDADEIAGSILMRASEKSA
jgi:hypothetical protein